MKPAGADQIPSIPLMNSGQAFHSNLQYLDFQGGSGVRFLAMYSQAVDPITNQDLVYTFQGLTSDGKYAVSAMLPIQHPSLPAGPNDLTQEELDAIYSDYGQYREQTAAGLSDQPLDSFTPNLAALDALIASIQVE